MTAQEAITALKLEKIKIEGNAIRVADFFRGLSVANIALEKQIPKKPLETKLSRHYELSEQNIEEGKCPSCGEKVTGNQFGYYCGSCGQALDWSEI